MRTLSIQAKKKAMRSPAGIRSTRISWLITLVLGLILISAGVASAAAEAVAGSSVAIRSGAEIDYPPFSIVTENGEAGGFSVELMRAALSAMCREVTFRTGPWAEVRGWLERGEIDALPLVGRTPEREALFDFTVPYMSLHGAIVVRGDETGIRDFSDLSGRQVAVMKGDNAEEFLRREKRDFEIRTTPTFEVALQGLAEGRHDAVVTQRLVALRLIQKTGLTNLTVIDRPIEGFRQDFCFAVHEGDRDTLALLNEGLAIVVADGTYRHLHAKWFADMQLPTDRPIIVGGDRDFPPFEFLDKNGHPAGYNVDLTRAIAREMGLNVDIRLGWWPERLNALKTGKIDMMQGMFYSPERGLDFDFSPAHIIAHQVAVVRRGEGPAPETVEALAGKRIVVQDGDILHDFALRHGLEDQLTVVPNQETALRELAEGKHDCALVSRITALLTIQEHGWSNLVLAKKALLAYDYCFAAAKGRDALLAQFSEGLKALENSGEYRRIHEKWLGVYQEQPTSFLTVLRYSAFVIIPLLVIALLALLWSWSLRRQVAEKTKALQESLDRFRYVFEAANVGKSITLPTGEVNANKAFADFLGYTCDELKGKRWQELTPPEDIEAAERHIAPLLSGEKDATRFEKRYVHKKGEYLWADVSAAIRRGTDGTPLYFMTTVVDINAHKQAEAALHKSEEFQRAMIACSPVALYTVDLDGNVLTWNSSAERIFGWRVEEISGRPLPIVPEDKRGEFEALRRQVIKDGGFFGEELARLRKDGTLFPVSLSVAPIRNDLGEVIGILGAAEDISERKNQEKRIEWNLRRNALLSETAARLLQSDDPQALVEDLCRRVMAFVDCQAFFNFLEDPRQGKLHLNACAGIPEQEAKKIEWLEHGVAVCGCVAKDRKPMVCESILNRDDPLTDLVKSYGIQAYCCHPLMIRDQLIGTLSFGRRSSPCFEREEIDLMASVTDLVAVAMSRIEMEHKLRDSESRFRMFAELAPVGIVISDENENTLYANPRFTELFGYTMEEIPSVRQWWELAYPDASLRSGIREQWRKTVEEARRAHSETTPVEYPVTCKDGKVRHIEFRMAATGNLNVLVFADITERKRAEEQRQEGFELLNNLARFVPGVIYQYRLYPDGRSAFPYSSPGMFDIYEVTPEEVREDASVVFGRIHPEDHDRVAEAIFESARTLNTFHCELRVILPEKGLGWRWSQAHPQRTEDGGTLWHGIILDITERKQAEKALREQEERLRAIFESIQDAVYLKDSHLRYTHCNAAMARMFGLGCEAIIGRTDSELFPMDSAKEIAEIDRRVLAGHHERGSYTRVIKGLKRIIDTSKAPVFDAAGNTIGICGVSRDITEEVNLREQMRQAQKMEAVGQLAGGVAHDYNNMLSVIIGYSEMALEKTASDDSLRADLAEILGAANRSVEITRQLLAFARRQTIAPKVIDLNESVEGMLKMLRRLIGEDIDLSWQPGPGRMPVFMDPSQLDQILANLCVNARDAIGGVGKLTIETGHVRFDAEYCADHAGFTPGNFIMLAVSDDGCGMDKQTMEKIFEPFFTTKGVGKGTGLGLSTVFGIVKQNDGFINVYSEPGKGTTFRIYLPPHEGADAGMEATEATEIPAGRGETVLVVEDETSILKLTQRMLERLGYSVLTAATPGEAVTLAEKHTSAIHLLITDVVMPDMNGRELTEKLQAHYPKLKVLFMSGYTANVIAHRGVLEAGVNFIQKPFSNRDLATKVREALEK